MRVKALFLAGNIFGVGLLVSTVICSVRYYNGSFDMGLHYALISRIGEGFSFPACGTDGDRYLEVMCSYPALTHLLAAVLGRLVGSPFLGMVLLTAGSVFVAYASILSMMKFEKDIRSVYATIALCLVCLMMGRHVSMIGAEVRGNFFFSQLVGTALLFAVVAFQPQIKFGTSIVFIFVFGWIYPIAAVELACTSIVSMVLARQSLGRIATFVALAASAIYFHPLFQSSSSNAGNNGDIGTGFVPAAWTMPIVFTLAGLSVFAAWALGKRRLPAFNAFISLSAGIAGAAIMQWAAFILLGQGSEYIVYKHLFVSVTMLAANLIIMVLFITLPAIPAVRLKNSTMLSIRVVGAVFCSMTILPPIGGGRSVLAFANAEKEAMANKDTINGLRNHHEKFALEVALKKVPISTTANQHFREMSSSLISPPDPR